MAVRPYLCPKSKETKFEAYVNVRSTIDQSIRIQRYKKCKTEVEALRAEKKIIRLAYEEVARREARGNCWGRVISLWEDEALKFEKNPVTGNELSVRSIRESVSMLTRWTEEWLPIPAKELTRGHGKTVLDRADEAELSIGSLRKIKNAVNTVYLFGIQEQVIQGVHHSPVYGIPLDKTSDKLPEILKVEEVKRLLEFSKKANHPWYVIWAVALMTGMRSSELYALRKENVLKAEGLIRISESWDWVIDEPKTTKAGYWRTAPIAGPLEGVLEKAYSLSGDSPYVFPRYEEWTKGYQAQVLRNFCNQIGISSVRFHTLRACFATHLLASGVDTATVMRIGGWRDFKTFQVYVRLAGINEKGATEGLGKTFFSSEKGALDSLSESYGGTAA